MDYGLFVVFFPYLISGPIVRHSEILSQLKSPRKESPADDRMIGATLFTIGLFKKTVLADGFQAYASPVFDLANHGLTPAFFQAWAGLLAFAFQLYFDFSGYSDMAIGTARMFGIQLPLNFNSPFKADSVLNFWRRWHMTLTRFLNDYVYNPFLLVVMRYRAARGKPFLQKKNASPGSILAVIGPATMLTMLVSGLWHGQGWKFVIFGLLHGIAITLNHLWDAFRQRAVGSRAWLFGAVSKAARPLTFAFVVFTLIFFRSESLQTCWILVKGVLGGYGVSLPKSLARHAGSWTSLLEHWGISFQGMTQTPLGATFGWLAAGLLITWFLPNSQEWVGQWGPALHGRSNTQKGSRRNAWQWQPTMTWSFLCAVIATWGLLAISRESTFLYFQF